MRVVKVEKEKLEAVSEFCYLGGIALCWRRLRAGCCNHANVIKASSATCPSPSHQPQSADRGRVYSTCVKNVMLHAVETWVMTATTQNSLWHNELAKIHWICNVMVRDEFI